jgi:carbon-monoxide dehydrogenase medium subunit
MSVPAPFEYHPARTVEEAIALLQQYGDEARVLAGGHSLIPAMKLRLLQPEHLIDIGRIDALSFIHEEQGAIAVGAMTTYITLARSDVLRRNYPLLPEAVSVIADQMVRNRGTIGGSIVEFDPAGDMPAVVLALKAEIVAQGPKGKRTIKADDFFVDTFQTALNADEIVTEIRFALPLAHTGSAYSKLENKASHYAVTGCAAVISQGDAGMCNAASLTITGAASRITRASGVEAALLGKKLDEATIADAASHAPDGMNLISDIHGSMDYRRQMTVVLAQQTMMKALERL